MLFYFWVFETINSTNLGPCTYPNAPYARSMKHRVLRTHAMTMTAYLSCFMAMHGLRKGQCRYKCGYTAVADTRLCGYATIIGTVVPEMVFADHC